MEHYSVCRDRVIERCRAKERYDFTDLCDIITVLRGEGGCPWDREQDHRSIRSGLIEECYEVLDAIDRDDAVSMREELGDVLLQIVFHSEIEREEGHFDVGDVIHDECVKMVYRHPHVFGDMVADSSGQVLENWEKLKNSEKNRKTLAEKLSGIPPMLPSLLRASKVSKKLKYNQDLSTDVLLDRVIAALNDLKGADVQEQKSLGKEAGELLFLLAGIFQRMGIDSEEVLRENIDEKIATISASENL